MENIETNADDIIENTTEEIADEITVENTADEITVENTAEEITVENTAGETTAENTAEETTVEALQETEPAAFVPESAPKIEETPLEENASADSTVSENDGEAKESAAQQPSKPADPAAAIEAILFATGNSLKVERLSEVLCLSEEETRAALDTLKERYASDDRGICLTELEDAVQLGTKGEYYEYLIKLAKSPKRMTLSDTVIETLSIIAYKQPVTRAEIERIRGVSCDHALNRLLEYELVEEVGRLDAPGKPLLFGTTEQFLRSFGVRSIQDLPVMSPEMMQDFKAQAEAEAEEDLKVRVDV